MPQKFRESAEVAGVLFIIQRGEGVAGGFRAHRFCDSHALTDFFNCPVEGLVGGKVAEQIAAPPFALVVFDEFRRRFRQRHIYAGPRLDTSVMYLAPGDLLYLQGFRVRNVHGREGHKEEEPQNVLFVVGQSVRVIEGGQGV